MPFQRKYKFLTNVLDKSLFDKYSQIAAEGIDMHNLIHVPTK